MKPKKRRSIPIPVLLKRLAKLARARGWERDGFAFTAKMQAREVWSDDKKTQKQDEQHARSEAWLYGRPYSPEV